MTASEYLATDFDRPVPEFVKGEIVERGSGTFLHGHTIGRLGGLFGPLRVGAIVHVRTAVDTYRVFDVAVLEQDVTGIPEVPPLIDVEVLSTDDRLADIVDRFSELRAWGVPHLWLVDPKHRCLYVFGRHGLT
jgi:Uma2 family endonuclease